MKRKYFIVILICVLCIAIGYASVTANFFTNGNILIAFDFENAEVYLANLNVNGINRFTNISNDKKSISIDVEPGESTFDVYFANNANDYNASISLSCNNDELNGVTITNPAEELFLEAQTINKDVYVVNNSSETQTLTCLLCFHPLEKEETDEHVKKVMFALPGIELETTFKIIEENTYGDLPIINDENYHFYGWYKETTFENQVTSETEVTSNVDEILYGKVVPYCEELIGNEWVFDYTGDKQEFNPTCPGIYKLEAYGAGGPGGNTSPISGGSGGYASGEVYLDKNIPLYIYVGGYINGYNGGGNGNVTDSNGRYCLQSVNASSGYANCTLYNDVDYISSSKGSGATDFRVIPASDNSWYDVDHTSWNEDESLLSRIVTAGGGGGYNATKSRQFKGAFGQDYFGNTSFYNNPNTGPTSNEQLGLGSDGIQGSLAMVEVSDGRPYHDQGYTASGGGGGGYFGGTSMSYTVSKDTVLAAGGTSYTYDSLFGNDTKNCTVLPGYNVDFRCNNSYDNQNNYAGLYARVAALNEHYHLVMINLNRYIGTTTYASQGTNNVQSYETNIFTYSVNNGYTQDLAYSDGEGMAKITFIG